MPISNSKLREPDPFIMNEDTVNIAIFNYLNSKGFESESPLSGKQRGIDVKARKGKIEIFVESKGSQKNEATNDEVFNHGQIVNHLARQIHTLMKYSTINGEDQRLYVLANPDLQRIKNEYQRIGKMVDKLQFICMWVRPDLTVVVECPDKLKGLLIELELL